MRACNLVRVVCITALLWIAGCGFHSGNRVISQIEGENSRNPHDPAAILAEAGPTEYTIGYGDLLDVYFMYNKDYSRDQIRVLPDGTISYPHVGTIRVVGMSVSQLDSLLTTRFSEILVDPDITVTIREFQSQHIYVIGEVGAPGVFPWEPGMTLIKALALGRGYTKDARQSNVVLIRRVAEKKIIGIEVDISEILDDHNFALDVEVQAFDIIYVPRSRIATTEQFVQRMYGILGRPVDLYLKSWQAANVEKLYHYYSTVGSQ